MIPTSGWVIAEMTADGSEALELVPIDGDLPGALSRLSRPGRMLQVGEVHWCGQWRDGVPGDAVVRLLRGACLGEGVGA